MTKCPLCLKNKSKSLEEIESKFIVSRYKKSYGIDISRLFSNHDKIYFKECENCFIRFFDPLISGDDQFYTDLQKFNWYYRDDKEEFEYTNKYIKPTDSVLEVGCGRGQFSKVCNSSKYVGLEFSTQAKIHAAKEGITIENESIQVFSQSNFQSFDVVCSFQVLEHVEDINGVIKSSLDALKPKGTFAICVPSHNSYLSFITNDTLNLPPHHISRWPDKVFEEMASIFNLNLISLYHHPLEEEHKSTFIETFFVNWFRKIFGIPLTIVNKSYGFKIIRGISGLCGQIFKKALLSNEVYRGHSITAIYTKK